MRRLVPTLMCVALCLAGCHATTAHSPEGAPPVRTTVTPTARPVAQQTGWMHGVSVDVPASWPRNQLHCGEPWRTTFVVEPAGAAVPLCFTLPPKHFHPDVVWLAAYIPPLAPQSVMGSAGISTGAAAHMTRTTVAGETAWTWSTRDTRTHTPIVFVVLPKRSVYVAAESMHRTVRDAVVASIRIASTDPATGCATRTTAYDAPPPHPRLDRAIDVSGATAVVTCHYVAGWLESTAAAMPPAGLRALVRAIDTAPHVTSARAPVDAGCEGLQPGPPQYSDDGPVVLRFSFSGGRSVTVVARVVMCTRWQSYVYSGSLERRMTGALLLALPRVLLEFPGPGTM